MSQLQLFEMPVLSGCSHQHLVVTEQFFLFFFFKRRVSGSSVASSLKDQLFSWWSLYCSQLIAVSMPAAPEQWMKLWECRGVVFVFFNMSGVDLLLLFQGTIHKHWRISRSAWSCRWSTWTQTAACWQRLTTSSVWPIAWTHSTARPSSLWRAQSLS